MINQKEKFHHHERLHYPVRGTVYYSESLNGNWSEGLGRSIRAALKNQNKKFKKALKQILSFFFKPLKKVSDKVI